MSMEEAVEWGNHRDSSMPGTGERDRRPSRGVVLGWDYERGITDSAVQKSPRAGDTVQWVDRSRRISDGRTEKLVTWCSFDLFRGVGVGARRLGSESDRRLVAVGSRVHAAKRHGGVDPGWTWCRRRSICGGGWNPTRHRGGFGERDDDGSSGPELRLRTGNSDDAGAGRAFHALDAAADAGPGQRTDQRGSTRGSGSHRSKDGQLVRNEPDCGPHKERKHPGWPGRSLFQSGDNDGIRFPASFQAAIALFPSDDTITRTRGFWI